MRGAELLSGTTKILQLPPKRNPTKPLGCSLSDGRQLCCYCLYLCTGLLSAGSCYLFIYFDPVVFIGPFYFFFSFIKLPCAQLCRKAA